MYTLAQLKTEIDNDPKALGLVALRDAGNDAGIAAKLNATYPAVGIVWRTNVASAELLAGIVWADVSAFTAAQWAAVQAMLSPTTIDASNVNIRNFFNGLFTGKATTIANLTAVAKVTTPTRAEEAWGAGTTVSDNDVARALGRA